MRNIFTSKCWWDNSCVKFWLRMLLWIESDFEFVNEQSVRLPTLTHQSPLRIFYWNVCLVSASIGRISKVENWEKHAILLEMELIDWSWSTTHRLFWMLLLSPAHFSCYASLTPMIFYNKLNLYSLLHRSYKFFFSSLWLFLTAHTMNITHQLLYLRCWSAIQSCKFTSWTNFLFILNVS